MKMMKTLGSLVSILSMTGNMFKGDRSGVKYVFEPKVCKYCGAPVIRNVNKKIICTKNCDCF